MIKAFEPTKYQPTHVQIEITWRCNWRCVHCYQDDHKLEVLSLDRLQDLFTELADAGTMHVIITGGEPLVREDIFEILYSIRQRGMGITLYTNGHRINGEYAKRLGNLIALAEVSILAGEEDIHDKLSGVRGSFKRVLNAIQELKKRDIDVIVKTPILKPAFHTLRCLESRLMELGVQWLADPEITRSYAGATYPLQYQLSHFELKQFFMDFPQFNPQSGYSIDQGFRRGMCLAGRQYCFIDALGNVYPCLNFKSACDVNEARGKEPIAKMGNILKESFGQIWENSNIGQRIRKANRDDFKTCNGCEAFETCGQCMALNYEEHGILFKPSLTVCGTTEAAISIKNPDFIPASMINIM